MRVLHGVPTTQRCLPPSMVLAPEVRHVVHGHHSKEGGHLRAKLDEGERELADRVVEATLQVTLN